MKPETMSDCRADFTEWYTRIEADHFPATRVHAMWMAWEAAWSGKHMEAKPQGVDTDKAAKAVYFAAGRMGIELKTNHGSGIENAWQLATAALTSQDSGGENG